MTFLTDLTGRSFDRLIVLKHDGRKGSKNYWLCRCSCGTVKSIQGAHLKNGSTSSCGCKAKEISKYLNTSHGMTGTPEYSSWRSMVNRCCNVKIPSYKRYKKNNISVCQEWIESFEAFYEHIGPRPTIKHTIDRIDNDKSYEPGNVRWATKEVQANNRRNVKLISFEGRTMSMAQWGRLLFSDEEFVSTRVRKGWNIEDALTIKSGEANDNTNYRRYIEFNGITKTLTEWAKHTGLSKENIYGRLKSGWSIEDALIKPKQLRYQKVRNTK